MGNINARAGARIRARRKELRLSVDAVALKLGKSRSMVYNYEKGESDITLEIINDLAKILDIEPIELTGLIFNGGSDSSKNESDPDKKNQWTSEEEKEIENFKSFLKMKRNGND